MWAPEQAPGGAGAAQGGLCSGTENPSIHSAARERNRVSTREGKLDHREGVWCENHITGNEIHLPGRWSRVCLRAWAVISTQSIWLALRGSPASRYPGRTILLQLPFHLSMLISVLSSLVVRVSWRGNTKLWNAALSSWLILMTKKIRVSWANPAKFCGLCKDSLIQRLLNSLLTTCWCLIVAVNWINTARALQHCQGI